MRKYSDSFSTILNYFFAVDVPWQFRLLVIKSESMGSALDTGQLTNAGTGV